MWQQIMGWAMMIVFLIIISILVIYPIVISEQEIKEWKEWKKLTWGNQNNN
jgi:hypothetical protein